MSFNWIRKYFKRKLNTAEWISMYRIFIAPVLLIVIYLDYQYLFATLLFTSFITDILDGYIARKLKITSDRGAQLDSMADAITFIVALVGIMQFYPVFFNEAYVLIIWAFIPYFFQLLLSIWRYGKPTSFHTYMAKIAAIMQAAFFLTLFYFGIIYWFFYVALAISVLETIEEIILIFLHPKWRSNVKGLYWFIMQGMKKHTYPD